MRRIPAPPQTSSALEHSAAWGGKSRSGSLRCGSQQQQGTPVSENALVDRETVWQIARLALISVYSLFLLAVDALFFERILTWWVALLFGVLWLAVAATFLTGLARADDRKRYLSRHAGYPLLLLAPLLVVPYWTPVLALVLLAAYILELRQLTAGKGFAFSAVLVVFVSIAATWPWCTPKVKTPGQIWMTGGPLPRGRSRACYAFAP